MGPEDYLWGISDPICIVFLFIIFAYFILMEAYVGWTIGKRLLGMRVVDNGGNRIGLQKPIIRNLLRLIDGLPAFNILAIILIASSQQRQRFGERIAKTYVIRGESNEETRTEDGNNASANLAGFGQPYRLR